MSPQTKRNKGLPDSVFEWFLKGLLYTPHVYIVSIVATFAVTQRISHFGGTAPWVSHLLLICCGVTAIAWGCRENAVRTTAENIAFTAHLIGRIAVCVITAIIFLRGDFLLEDLRWFVSILPLLALGVHLLCCILVLAIGLYASVDLLRTIHHSR